MGLKIMWVIKSKEEYKKDQLKRFKEILVSSFSLSFITIFFITIMSKFGCRGNNPHQYELTWKQVLELIPFNLLMVLFSTIFFTLIYFFGERKIICENCSKEKYKIFQKKCICGGSYILQKKYKNIEELGDINIPTYDEVKNINWNDFKNKYNLELTDFKFLNTMLDVPKKYNYSNPNLYLVIENILELTPESSYLQIIMKNKSYVQITLNYEGNFILVHYDKKSYIVESSRNLDTFKIIDALNLYYNNYSGFKEKFQWVELVNIV